jgi:predicted TIM-barrel fold metal-dependent hydrolase
MPKEKMLFGTGLPLITPDRWVKDFEEAGLKEEVHQLILKDNAVRLPGLS